jgi:hypothetical protein
MMRPLGSLLRRESPLTLAREAMWRASKPWRRKHALKALGHDRCEPRFRPVGYFRPALENFSAQARETILNAANSVLAGRMALLGYGPLQVGMPPAWNCDFVSCKTWPQIDSALIQPVRHDGSDVKVPWELSRLQFLPVLAKAYRLSGEEPYRNSAKALLSNWIANNPFGTGVNWCIAMEVALRAISICLTLDLLWPLHEDEQTWLEQVTGSLWQHYWFIVANPEFSYLGRSNHYLSNIVGLLCLATFLDSRETKRRRLHYQKLVEEEMFHQTNPDGGDFEASTGYHVLVTQMFTCSLMLIRAAGAIAQPKFVERLRRMYVFTAALADAAGRIPHIGDCDDGRVELLTDDLRQSYEIPECKRHSLTIPNFLGIGRALFGELHGGGAFDDAGWYGLGRQTCAKLSTSAGKVSVLPHSGVAAAREHTLELLFLGIPNGGNGKGSHTHNDKLSFVFRVGGEELFCDCGTGVYSRDEAIRNRFRSTAAHNTIVVDGTEQNRISRDRDHLFYLGNNAQVSSIQCEESAEGVTLAASHFGYRNLNVVHSRRLRLCPGMFQIEDTLDGDGEHDFEMNFHFSPHWRAMVGEGSGTRVSCRFTGPSSVSMLVSGPRMELTIQQSQVSRSYGSVVAASRLCIRGRASLPATLVSLLECQPEMQQPVPAEATVERRA